MSLFSYNVPQIKPFFSLNGAWHTYVITEEVFTGLTGLLGYTSYHYFSTSCCFFLFFFYVCVPLGATFNWIIKQHRQR